jgi:hypothetical protein
MTLLGGLAALTAAWFTLWSGESFPARSARLAGTPAQLRIQDGVTPRELHAIRAGVRTADRYLRRSLGRAVSGPVEVRIARADPCRSSESGERSVIGEGAAGFVCVDTGNVEWKVLISTDRPAAIAVAAHEYVHVWQAELGCLPQGERRDYRWIVEGMATDLAWRALAAAGRVSGARLRRTIRRERPFDPGSKTLRTYERAGGRPPQYALWHLAIRSLLREAVRNGAAPRTGRQGALRTLCAQVGAGLPWRAAFLRSFGISVAEFYARFEAKRPGADP